MPRRSTGRCCNKMGKPSAADYRAKFDKYSKDTSFGRLGEGEQVFIRGMAEALRFTFQELRQVSEAALDLRMWKEERKSNED